MRIAIVHDWLVTYAGAERVLEQLLALYPEAHLYSLFDFVPREERAFLGGRQIHTSSLQRIPGMPRWYRSFLPVMPFAIEQFDLSRYELVISSSYAVAKGVITGPEQTHLCYCHSPLRYAWDLQHQYLRQAGLHSGLRSLAARYLLHRMRIWDVRTANGVDRFIANSRFIARRIAKTYRRKAAVIYPPVDVEFFTPGGNQQNYYVTASRMVPYKRMDLIIDAFASMPHQRLIVIGDGPDAARLRARGSPNVQFLGRQPLDVLRQRLRQARAFIFAAEEDFGIAPLEAQACGTPVIAFGKGGVLETIRGIDSPEPTGVFFPEQSTDALGQAVATFEQVAPRLTPEACRANALRFEPARFRREFAQEVQQLRSRAVNSPEAARSSRQQRTLGPRRW